MATIIGLSPAAASGTVTWTGNGQKNTTIYTCPANKIAFVFVPGFADNQGDPNALLVSALNVSVSGGVASFAVGHSTDNTRRIGRLISTTGFHSFYGGLACILTPGESAIMILESPGVATIITGTSCSIPWYVHTINMQA